MDIRNIYIEKKSWEHSSAGAKHAIAALDGARVTTTAAIDGARTAASASLDLPCG